ncbi:MAG TPA: 3-deoxy-D-manno-octulosonic acid transferase [Gemmataceae bacterium]|nr:3-deoxy-D-manno-octulosonic acid transferase [Gemmataceae bacterium]
MPFFLNALYLAVLVVLSPWLVCKALTTGKYRRGMWRKLTGAAFARPGDAPCAWFHGVSVGEVHLLRSVIAAFRRRHPEWQCVVSTTTDTGFDEARKHFADLPVFFWPLDFSWAVRRALRRVRPSLVVLAEGEMWPNFLLAAERWRVPVAVINARMSPRSFGRYRRLGGLTRRLLAKIELFAAQTPEYATHLRLLGAAPERVHVTGSVKYDGTSADRGNPKTQELRRLLGVGADDLVLIAGSTQEPEEEIALGIFRRLREEFPRLRLLVVPRQKERFDEVAALLKRSGEPFVRRSELAACGLARTGAKPVVLVDTIGELGAVWGLADVAFVGGSLDGKRGGQNMIEPAAYAAAVLFGPHVWNFRDAAARLTAAGGALQVADAAALEAAVRRLLADGAERAQMGAAARYFVKEQQGATERTLALLDRLLAQARARAA